MVCSAMIRNQVVVLVVLLAISLAWAFTTEVPETTPGPNDLVLVDYIIIGVTSAVAGIAIIGGIVYSCIQCCKSKVKDGIKDGVEDRLDEKKHKSKKAMAGDLNLAYDQQPLSGGSHGV